MELRRFELEHWLAAHENRARYALGTSGVAAAPRELLPEPATLADHGYGEVPGEPALLAAVSEFTGRPEEELLVTVGGTEANFLAFLAAVEPGKRVLVESPTYFPLAEVPRVLGARVERFTRRFEDGFRVDVNALIERIGRDVSAVALSNPNNPTGQIVPPADLRAVAEACEDAGAVLIVDEIFRDLALDPVPRARTLAPNVATTESLTKCYGLSGLRTGWLVGPPAFVARAREAKALTSITNARQEQHLAARAIERRELLLARSRAIVRENLPRLAAFIEEAGWSWVPTRAPPLAAPRLPEGTDDVKLCERLLQEAGVLLVPGSYVDLPGHVRFCVGAQPATFAAGVARVRARFSDGRLV